VYLSDLIFADLTLHMSDA